MGWWLEHIHGWLVKHQWAESVLGRVTHDEYQVLGSTSIPARLDTLVYQSMLYTENLSHGSPMLVPSEAVIRLGWSRIGLAVLILHTADVGLIGRPAVNSGRHNKCHSPLLQNHYAQLPPPQHKHTHTHTYKHNYLELVMGNDHEFRGIVCRPWQEESCVIG